jgi:hypothetical protein
MKFSKALFFLFLILSFASCDLVNELIPDVNTDFTKPFQIQIFSNNGESQNQMVDVTTSSEYNNFKSNIGGFEITKITYKIKNFNAPEDMYFNGTVICSNEEASETYTIGTMKNESLSELAATGLENNMTLTNENITKIIGWLESPGRFNVRSGYALSKQDGTPYGINGTNAGSNFEFVVKFYVTVKTKVK